MHIDYLRNNDLILYPTYRIYDGEYEFGGLADLLQKNNFAYNATMTSYLASSNNSVPPVKAK